MWKINIKWSTNKGNTILATQAFVQSLQIRFSQPLPVDSYEKQINNTGDIQQGVLSFDICIRKPP